MKPNSELKKLRGYQSSSIEALRTGIRNGHVRQVLCSATGSGKSIIMTDMINSANKKNSKIAFVCERRILVEQFSKHLDRAGIDHGILMAGTWRFRPEENVQVCSIQTLEKMESLPKFDVMFIDEVHACMRKSVINLIKTRPDMRIIGATATPFHPALGEHFSNVVNVISMRELVNGIPNDETGELEQFLVPFRVFVAHEIDTTGLKTGRDGEWEKAELEKRGTKVVGDIVSDYIKLSHDVFGEYRKTICFSAGVAHGAELALKFNEAGVPAVQISYKDDDEYKQEVLREFAKPDTTLKVVISSDILQRGFDMSDVYHVILARPLKKSFSTFVQMVGRGARLHPEKEFCLIQDNSGNWLRFSEQWEELFHDGVSVLSAEPDMKAKKEPSDKEKAASKCPQCGCIWIGAVACAHCGYVKPVVNKVEAVAGEMLELTSSASKKKEFTAEQKQDWYSQLLYLESTWKVKKYWSFAMFIKKFGHKPAGYKNVSKIASPEVIGWCKSGFIAHAKATK